MLDTLRATFSLLLAYGLLLMAYALGACLGPVIAGVLMSAFSPGAMFIYTAAVMTLLGLFSLYRMTRRATPEAQRRRAAIVLPGGHFTGGQLYSAARRTMDRDFSPMVGGGEGRPGGSDGK